MAARLGRDEFTAIMDALPRPAVPIVASKIVQAMHAPFVIEQRAFVVATSVGLTFYQGDAATVQGVV